MKTNKDPMTFRRGDFLLILFILALLVFVGVFWKRKIQPIEQGVVQIYRDGTLIEELSLEKDTEFTVEGAYNNKISIKDGQAAVIESDCPGNDCVKSGWIHEAGRSVICLPNKMELRIAGSPELDGIAR